MIAISDQSSEVIHIIGKDRDYEDSISLKEKTKISGLKIISKLNLMAMTCKEEENKQHCLIVSEIGDRVNDLKMKYKIGNLKGDSKDRMNDPKGVDISISFDLIAVCDRNNKRISFFKLSNGAFETSLQLTFKPFAISLSLSSSSSSSSLMVISDPSNHKVHLFHLFIENQSNNHRKIDFAKKGEIGNGYRGSEISSQFNTPLGVAIHRSANYMVVADSLNSRLQFFSLEGKFLASFSPSIERSIDHSFILLRNHHLNDSPLIGDQMNNNNDFMNNNNNNNNNNDKYFVRPVGLSIDRKQKLIAVSDPILSRVFVFHSPSFSHLS